mmetsp:Transcript_19968/g.35593  ORF Transcript_19968/g.35593 Transcript_19968/m.35593 type:complete len:94 (+) Transcript_19968:67-348(+)
MLKPIKPHTNNPKWGECMAMECINRPARKEATPHTMTTNNNHNNNSHNNNRSTRMTEVAKAREARREARAAAVKGTGREKARGAEGIGTSSTP